MLRLHALLLILFAVCASAIRIRNQRRHVRSGGDHIKRSRAASEYVAAGAASFFQKQDSTQGALLQDRNSSDVPSPGLKLNSLFLFSKRLVEADVTNGERAPCVVFFPGDVSDLLQNLAAQKPEYQVPQWTLEGIHTTIARRFPAYDVMTIRGELIGTRRSFNNLALDPLKSIGHVEALLSSVESGSNLILVGFSRGGLGISALINGAEADPGFWKRVESVHYADVGGDGWVGDAKGLSVLAQSNSNIWLNFQLTPWCESFADGRNRMIALARSVKLFVQVEAAPVANSFAEHMRILGYFNVFRSRRTSLSTEHANSGDVARPVDGNLFGSSSVHHGSVVVKVPHVPVIHNHARAFVPVSSARRLPIRIG